MRFADMSFGRCEQELSYCLRLRDAFDANVEVVTGVVKLKCWFFDMPYTDIYLMRGGTYRTKVLDFETREKATVRKPVLERWSNIKTFGVSTKDLYSYGVTVPTFW